MFLIDSICKNVGEPYPSSFVKHGLVSAYIRIFGEICAAGDEVQKRDFLRVLPTWNGIFVPETLREIEQKINTFPVTNFIPQHQVPHIAQPIVKSSLSESTIKLLQDLQGVFEKPPGPHISGIVGEIFKRLARSGELSKETFEELDFKAKLPNKREIIEALKLLLVLSIDKSKLNEEPIINTSRDTNINNNNITPSKNQSQQTPNISVPLNFELPPNFQIDLSLLNSIVELNKLNTNTSGTSSFTSSQSPIKSTELMSINSGFDKNFVDIPLTSADLLISRPNLFKILYEDLALHCKTCGIRFRDTELGRQRLTTHLDSHFRRNMRLKEKSKRVMARDWFGSEKSWIEALNGIEGENSEKGVNIFEDFSGTNTNEETISNAHSETFFIEATEVEQNSQIKCDTCQEIISLIWKDETEQWIFPACIRNEFQKIVHFNCSEEEQIKRPIKRQKK